jgi:CheY-like chemotaxis protein
MASVIVAEDDVDHQRIITEVLRRLGHDVALVDDGRAALEEAGKHRPDLLIADVDMPRMDGLRLCRAVRDDPVLADTPVLIVTALLPPNDPALAASGATGYLREPFRVPDLRDAVQAQLFLRSSARPTTDAPAPTSTSVLTEALLASLPIGVAVCDTPPAAWSSSTTPCAACSGTTRRTYRCRSGPSGTPCATPTASPSPPSSYP